MVFALGEHGRLRIRFGDDRMRYIEAATCEVRTPSGKYQDWLTEIDESGRGLYCSQPNDKRLDETGYWSCWVSIRTSDEREYQSEFRFWVTDQKFLRLIGGES